MLGDLKDLAKQVKNRQTSFIAKKCIQNRKTFYKRKQTNDVLSQLVNMQRENKKEEKSKKKKNNYDSDESKTDSEEGTYKYNREHKILEAL
jgi:hypothetical protein